MKKLLAAVVVAGLAFMACQKEFSYENGLDPASTGAWEFKDSANTKYSGDPVQYYIDDTTDPTTAHMVYSGASTTLNATIAIEVYFPTGNAATGTYTSALGQVNFLYQPNTGSYLKVDAFSGQISTENISVSITQINDTSVTGTFSGTALDSTNRLKIVKEGKFTFHKRTTAPAPAVSVGTLGTATDTCTGAVVSGTYKKGTAVTTNNSITITANVTTIGTYTIFSDTLKGIHFAGAGTFTTTGIQSVSIPAIGTPTDSGTVRFRIKYGTSNCTVRLKIDTASGVVVVPAGDYLPLTTNSNWSYDNYDLTGTFTDSVYVRSTGTTKTLAGNAFNILLRSTGDSLFYRKGNGLYYRAIDLTSLIGSGGQQQTICLKDSVPNNSTWVDSFNITFLTAPAKLKLTSTITAKGVAATVGANTYPDVIKVSSVAVVTVTGVPLPVTAATDEFWYARGKGIIYEKFVNSAVTPSTTKESRLRRSQIF